jgi:hypothetical protein
VDGAPGGGRLKGSILFLGFAVEGRERLWEYERDGLVALTGAGSLDESCKVVWNLNLRFDTNR